MKKHRVFSIARALGEGGRGGAEDGEGGIFFNYFPIW